MSYFLLLLIHGEFQVYCATHELYIVSLLLLLKRKKKPEMVVFKDVHMGYVSHIFFFFNVLPKVKSHWALRSQF